jgi:hypothetical protein
VGRLTEIVALRSLDNTVTGRTLAGTRISPVKAVHAI